MHPYRTPAEPHATPHALLDDGLVLVACVVWAGSVLRAIVAAMMHEAPSQELALAFMLTIAIPLLARRARSAARAQTSHAPRAI